ncbi:cell migration-inducing and hyaluronan-binding protein [Parambassis ranga]|uniref:hyaluronoglucosaminidase n=1 Tax=Parambassis ranga TaxID=210632 RepID=A0A6P7HXV4_9TELE|nr:cell migration-inducing and hyaluronan-binding protein [Parambassis ranga]XP_028258459.1 cell migration-inducing and hyaluronan-binding protein [Parambassis ranga]XP_028258460.1 cell migration-inducing and hyaluronan-binding protein [Parambassis ranga]XP_028258462.1 cell migration-inducing and hyaluronan-binding protein [Parambassis ranga]
MKTCIMFLAALLLPSIQAVCPDKEPGLQPWVPGHSEAHRVTIGYGRKVLLTSSATVHSIEILNGGKLVIADTNRPILLRTKHILIGNKGELHIGSPDCPYRGNLTISLFGRLDDSDEEHSYFGRKYIGVGTGGTLEIHGERKLSWTFLNKTLHPGESNQNNYLFQRSWGNRGIIVHIIDPKTGEVLRDDRFDTYRSKDESRRLAKYLDDVETGLILAMVVNDEGSNNLEDSAKKNLTRLGSRHITSLGFRHPWTFIVKKGDPSSAVEDHAVYQGTKASSEARSSNVFQSSFEEHFTITTTSQWVQEAEWSDWFDRDDERGSGDWEKLSDLHEAYPDRLCSSPLDIQAETHDGVPSNLTGDVIYRNDKDYGFVCLNKDQTHGLCQNYRVRFLCGKLVRPQASISIDILSDSSILELADEPAGWRSGDRVVVASTDYSMHQAEEFTLLPCPICASNQVKVKGKALYIHIGEEVDGVDMRAEVGLLNRNILFRGEMEPGCYGNEACNFFDFDTFGGHLKVERGFRAVHISGVELLHMGQQTMGHYPVHFHMNGDVDERGGYDPPTYVSDLSIHHSFSRCVTIHGSNGLLVKDVVGYETLGHCFFTEDGPEERNTFDHCLGMMVRAGTLLPSDRDSKMCRHITDGSYPGYVANPRQDCSATSTFWIANPNNNLINCAAAGSEETGFWFIFHHVPTGPSEGLYSPGQTELTPMGHFINNRAHSNYRAGMILDNGVKTTQANDKDKRPFLSLVGARYGPHQDADPFKPRVPALIHHFVAYKNQDHGAWLRGGDVWLDDCQFADNGVGLTLASGGTFPDDDGSRQEVKNSLFVGESDNHGMPLPDNRIWGPGGSDHTGRTLPRAVDFPMRGMQIYDGPINVQNCTFRKYIALDGRHTSAFGFRLNNSWQSCPNNNVSDITFDHVPITSRVFFGEPGPWFNKMQMDGDKTTIFHDIDGSVSEYPGAFLVKEDNWLLRHPDCIDVPDWKAAICSGHYAQLYIQTRNPANLNMHMVKDEYPDRPLTLEGALGKRKHYQQFQPVIMLAKGYTIHWDQAAPAEVTIWLINFNKNDWINVGICYPQGTSLTIISDIHNRLTKQTRKTGVFMKTSQRDKINHSHQARGYYYWEEDTGLLFLKVKAHNNKEQFAFCSEKGCERVKITAVIPKGSPPSNCMAQAYPRHAELPVVDVPMPRKIPNARLHTSEHFLEIKLESYSTRFYHIKEDFTFTEVNGKKLYQPEDGVQLTVIDGHDGKMVESRSFRNSILQGIPAQIDNYVSGLKDDSIVLMTSKGPLITRGAWTKVLERLGADKNIKLKDKLAFVGFKGSFHPDWVHLEVDSDRAKIHQVLPVPVVHKMKL